MADLESTHNFFGKVEMNLFRAIDANINRASEGLRVLEDACRFIYGRQALATEFKTLRHELRNLWNGASEECITQRDVGADEGREVEGLREYARENVREIVISNSKRVQEALRSLEEFYKCESGETARQVEAIRYRCYHLEQTLLVARKFPWPCINVLLTKSLCALPPLEVLEQVCASGADVLQLREKEMEDGAFLDWIFAAKEVADRFQVPIIVNDRLHLVQITNVAGVHLGQGDVPTAYARPLLQPGQWLGRSTHNIHQARQAQNEKVDYIGVGPLYLTQTKVHRSAVGLSYLMEVQSEMRIPYVGIGAVNREHLQEILSVKPRGLAICSAVIGHAQPGNETAFYKQALKNSLLENSEKVGID